MGESTFRVTASTGGWRSLPWPFGLLDVTDDWLGLRSWHWSWWVADKEVIREAIKSIQVSRRFGSTTLRITTDEAEVLTVRVAISPENLIQDLRDRGYPIRCPP